MVTKVKELFKQLEQSLMIWLNKLDAMLFDPLLVTASNDILTRKLIRHLEKFYDIIQNTVDQIWDILEENDLEELTPEWEKEILKGIRGSFSNYQKVSKELHKTHQKVLESIPEDLKEEFVGVCFDITPEIILDIAKKGVTYD